MSIEQMGGPGPEEMGLKKEVDDLDQRAKEALEAFQEKYPWIQEGAKFRFVNNAPQPSEGIYRDEVYSHDFKKDTFVADIFYKSKDGETIDMGASTHITIVGSEGNEITPEIRFYFTLDEINNLAIEEVK